MRGSKERVMADRDRERFERNQNLIARMAAPPTRAQLLAQLDEELNEAIDLAVRLNERTTARGLRMVRLELCQIRRREDLKNKG
jgi:hypothetical protein